MLLLTWGFDYNFADYTISQFPYMGVDYYFTIYISLYGGSTTVSPTVLSGNAVTSKVITLMFTPLANRCLFVKGCSEIIVGKFVFQSLYDLHVLGHVEAEHRVLRAEVGVRQRLAGAKFRIRLVRVSNSSRSSFEFGRQSFELRPKFPTRRLPSALQSSVLPTPVGPQKMNEAIGRLGFCRPARARRTAFRSHAARPHPQ